MRELHSTRRLSPAPTYRNVPSLRSGGDGDETAADLPDPPDHAVREVTPPVLPEGGTTLD